MGGGGGNSSQQQFGAGGPATPFAGGVQEAQGAFGPTLPFPNTGSAASSAFGGIGNLNTNPAAQYGTAAGVGQQLTGLGGQVAGQAGQFAPYIDQTLQTGFDPQAALYAKLFQQNKDQTNAQNAMSGVATTPYGAMLSNQSGQDFNLNWQNQQLQRQQTAAGTASTLSGAGNADLAAGTNAATAGLGMGQQIDTQQFNAQQQQIQDWLNYIGSSGANASEFLSALQGLLGGAVNQASVTNTGAQQSNAGNAASLAGLGSLFGSVAKLGTAFL